ncbi:MAG: hypothetical protein ACI9C4_001691 [Paraglaciecola sp.]|jgi:hypothetical protein
MNRRDFIKYAGLTSVMGTLPTAFQIRAGKADFNGKFLITLQAQGGWDVSSLCDPKMNVPGEAQINHWAINDETQTAGNIQYAPFGTNQKFFDKYYNDMLIINGIDAQTNSHTAGVVHNWSGRISNGFPTLTALYAASNAPDLPISYINNGGYAETAGITRYSRLDEPSTIKNIVKPNQNVWNPEQSRNPARDWDLINQTRAKIMAEKLNKNTLTFRERLAISNYNSALESASILRDFSAGLTNAGELEEGVQKTNFYSSLKTQAQLALIAMNSGVAVSADLLAGGAFDSHQFHDRDQAESLAVTTDGIDYIWQYAEQLGIADRLVVVVMSDFSRTPYYNVTEGKDHWPVGSAIIMERDAPWGNRTVGLTDQEQNVIPINPATLQPQESGGSIIYPKHVMQSLREYMGIADNPLVSPFAFNNGESFDFFSATKSTPQAKDVRNSIRV